MYGCGLWGVRIRYNVKFDQWFIAIFGRQECVGETGRILVLQS